MVAWLTIACALSLPPQRREALGLPPGDTDPTFEEFSDEEYVHLEDPPELVEARNRLAAYTYRQGEEEPAGEIGALQAPALSLSVHIWKHGVWNEMNRVAISLTCC